MRFASLPSMPQLQQRLLQQAASQHIPHALLFAGKQGGGQWAMSLAFATLLLCEQQNYVSQTDSCGTCKPCRHMHAMTHPDVHFLFPLSSGGGGKSSCSHWLPTWRKMHDIHPFFDLEQWLSFCGSEGKQAIIPVEEARQLIQKLSLAPFEGKYKLILIWLPEHMHHATANALLKVVEEPPPYTIFLMATEAEEQILPTIRSRLQTIHVPPYSVSAIEEWLITRFDISPSQANEWALLSAGNIVEAIRLSQNTNETIRQLLRDWLRHCWRKDWLAIHTFIEEIVQQKRGILQKILQYAVVVFGEALLQQHTSSVLTKPKQEHAELASGIASVVSNESLEKLIKSFEYASFLLGRSVNPRLIMLNLSADMLTVFQVSQSKT